MSALSITPSAAKVLRDAGLERASLRWEAEGLLVVAMVREVGIVLRQRPCALLVLADPAQELPEALTAATLPRTVRRADALALPSHVEAVAEEGGLDREAEVEIEPAPQVEVAFIPVSGAELVRRLQWLEARVERALASRRVVSGGPAGGAERRLQTLAAAGRVAATITHELRNALACSCTNLDYLLQAMGPQVAWDPEFRVAAQEARDAVRHALDTGSLILALARDAKPVMRGVDLNAVVDQTLKLARPSARCRFERELAAVPQALGDWTALVQVLLNLLLNAAEAAGPHGRVVVRTAWAQGSVLLAVSDSGPGIPAEVAANLFERFATGRPGQGTGIGLALCRELVEAIDGSIEVGRGPMGGAEFRVLLRAASSEALQSA